jgi:hypothetical protein
MTTIGAITTGTTSEFQKATFINDHSLAYEALGSVLDSGWYPENAQTEWTDIAVLDEKYYAVFGEDSVMASDSKAIYIEVEPTASMIKEYEYLKQY